MARFNQPEYEGPPRNREEWRLARKQDRRSGDPETVGLSRAVDEYKRQLSIRKPFLRGPGTSIPSLVYQGPNLLPLVQAVRTVSEILAHQKTPSDSEKRKTYENNLREDNYAYQPAGVSLRDIESLGLPLDREGFGRIGRIFRADKYFLLPQFINRRSQKSSRVIEMLYVLAVQPQARDFPIPKDLTTIQQRAQAFFDYGVGYFTNLYPDLDEELNYLATGLINSPDSIVAVLSYVPARFGILPRTVYETFNTKVELSPNGGVWWAYKRKSLDLWLKDAYPLGTLESSNIDPAVSKVENRKPAIALAQALSKSSQNPEEPVDLQQELAGYRQALRAKVLNQRGAVLEIEPEESIVRKLRVGAHNNLASRNYRGTLLLEVFTGREEDPVVVEMDRTGRVWGTPAEVLIRQPNGCAILTREVSNILLAYSREALPVRVLKIDPKYAFPIIKARAVVVQLETEVLPPKEKVKTRGIPFIEPKHELPKKAEAAVTKAAIVDYTRDTITGHLKKVKDRGVINRIIADISRFEITGQGIYQLEQARRRGLDVFGLRSGDHRTVLTATEGSYKVIAILNRSDYNNSNLDKLLDSIS